MTPAKLESRGIFMDQTAVSCGRMLGELLVMQRWAGGDHVSESRIFGLLKGFESALNAEQDAVRKHGISAETQDRVEDLLQEIDDGTQATNPMSVKAWLHAAQIEEDVAEDVMQLCLLESRFPDVIDRLASEPGSPFAGLMTKDFPPNRNWFGSLHYIELFDAEQNKLHAVFAPAIPREGEYIQPEGGEIMRVVEVVHIVAKIGDNAPILVPHVYLESDDDDVDGDDDTSVMDEED